MAYLDVDHVLEISELSKLISVGSQKLLSKRVSDRLCNVDVAEYCDFVIAPLLKRVGESTRAGVMSVGYEHLASNAIKAALSGYRSSSSKDMRLKVLACTLPGNLHDLPCSMIEAVCECIGVSCFNVGAATPVTSILELTADLEVDYLAISFSYSAQQDDNLVKECYDLLEHLPPHVQLLLGGCMADSVGSIFREKGKLLTSQVAFKDQILS